MPEPQINKNEWGDITFSNLEEIKLAIDKVYLAANECPTCTLAALRQKKITITDDIKLAFDYKKIVQDIFADARERQLAKEESCYY